MMRSPADRLPIPVRRDVQYAFLFRPLQSRFNFARSEPGIAMTRRIRLSSLIVFVLLALIALLPPRADLVVGAGNKDGFRKIADLRERIAPRANRTTQLSAATAGKLYSLNVSLPAPASLSARDGVI